MKEDENDLFTIKCQLRSEIKIKRSVFQTIVQPVESLVDAKTFISETAKDHKTATHNCWAYIVGKKGEMVHCSDAGEPPGTAGKPMLNALQHNALTDVAVVVTRYYGGVKLGVRGLMDAYFRAVDETLDPSIFVKKQEVRGLKIKVGYDLNDKLISIIKTYDARIKNTQYADGVTHDIVVSIGDYEELFGILDGYGKRGLVKVEKSDNF